MSEGMSGRREQAHRAVAEEVERTLESPVAAHVGSGVVQDAPVERLVEMCVAVALTEPAGACRLPFGAVDDERRVRELGRAAGVVAVKMRHDDDADLLGLDAERAQSRGGRLVAFHSRGQQPCLTMAQARARVLCDRGVEAGVDQQRSGGRMLDEEDGDGHPAPARARRRQAAQPGQRATRTVERGRRQPHLAAAQRSHAHRRTAAAAGEREPDGLGHGRDRHVAQGNRPLAAIPATFGDAAAQIAWWPMPPAPPVPPVPPVRHAFQGRAVVAGPAIACLPPRRGGAW